MVGSFTIKTGELDKLIGKIKNVEPKIHNTMEKKMNQIVQVVYATARARRPKISITKDNRGIYRVSDPNANIGVPVATGALQQSITKNVSWNGKKIDGEIEAGKGLVYAEMIEFGTSRMQARPFMRPAWNENLQWIKKKWKEKIEKL